MLIALYQLKVNLIVKLYEHCVQLMRKWQVLVELNMTPCTASYLRSRKIITEFNPRSVHPFNVDQLESDLDYVIEEASEHLDVDCLV